MLRWNACVPVLNILLLMAPAQAQVFHETLLTPDNAYNPIPSPDGKYVAYVRTGWGRPLGSGGFGRSNLISEVAVADAGGNLLSKKSVCDGFLAGWTPGSADLLCYRDGNYSLVSTNGKASNNGRLPGFTNVLGTERVSYLPRNGTIVWSRQNGDRTVLETPEGVLASSDGWQGELASPSPNGRYIAIAGGWPHSHLWVYEVEGKKWTDLGEIDIHPDPDWDYIKPAWNPWFADSSRLAYFSHDASILTIRKPDGQARTDIHVHAPGGIPSPSPDGQSIAYVTFEPRPRKERPDLLFWGGTQVWVVSLTGEAKPRPVTEKSADETYDLRWLNDRTLAFDRVADVSFYRQSRIWTAEIAR